MGKAERLPHPFWILLSGWLVPGLGHWMIHRTGKAALFFVFIVGTFVGGMALAGFDNVYYAAGRWTALTQYPAGAIALVGTYVRQAAGAAAEEQMLFKIGTLYTSVAGLLNVLVMMDATYSAWRRRGGVEG